MHATVRRYEGIDRSRTDELTKKAGYYAYKHGSAGGERAPAGGKRRDADQPPVLIVEKGVLDSHAVDTWQVALIPSCTECDARWLPADEERWRAYLTDDEPPELAFFCPECSEREFADLAAFGPLLAAKDTYPCKQRQRKEATWPRQNVDTED
jgi:hypothetical protein